MNKINKSLKTKRIKGFILVLVITIIGFVGVVMYFLAGASNSMMFQANEVYLQACERNLISSGLNWARTNIQKNNFQEIDDTIQLDISDMDILNSSLNVIINKPENKNYKVQINSSCSRSRNNFKTSETFTIESH